MTYPRAHLVDSVNGGVYHCISRCVRRSWLCGRDPLTGFDFEHRRAWLETRVLALCELFAVELYGYAIMSNHYHLVVQTVPKRTALWSDDQVARRWCSIRQAPDEHDFELRVAALVAVPQRIAVLRERLASLSWLMRFINEPLARLANEQDNVTGRFWEGRFKSFALLDEAAIIACMAYVDLNPVRAKAAATPTDCAHTSIARRLRTHDGNAAPLRPLSALGLTLAHYEQLLSWTLATDSGQVKRPSAFVASTLARQRLEPDDWLQQVRAHRFKYRAYGAASRLADYAQTLGQRWICGAKAMMTPV